MVPAVVGAVGAGGEADVEASAEATVSPEPRDSIRIVGDENFTEENGVRSGNGTAEDPYVISDWLIVHGVGSGIAIRDTDAHVAIERVLVRGAWGITLDEAHNVTIRGSQLVAGLGSSDAIEAMRARNLTIETTVVTTPHADVETDPVPHREWLALDGIDLVFVEDATVRNVTVVNHMDPLRVWGSEDVLVEHSSFRIHDDSDGGTSWKALFARVDDLTLRQNRFEKVPVVFDSFSDQVASSDISIEENTIENATRGVEFEFGETWLNVTVCGTTFRELSGIAASLGTGLDLRQSVEARLAETPYTIEHNRFVGTERALNVDSNNLTMTGNLVQDSRDQGIGLNVHGAMVHDNAFENNPSHWVIGTDNDLRHNWWGAPDGPSGMANGSGDPINWDIEKPAIDPPLTEPPELHFDCVPGDAVGDQHEVTTRVSAHATASASASFNETVGPVHANVHENAKIGPLHVQAHQNAKVGPVVVEVSVNESVSRDVGPFAVPG